MTLSAPAAAPVRIAVARSPPLASTAAAPAVIESPAPRESAGASFGRITSTSAVVEQGERRPVGPAGHDRARTLVAQVPHGADQLGLAVVGGPAIPYQLLVADLEEGAARPSVRS